MVENGQETGDSALGLTARADVLKELELSGCAVGGDPAGPWAVEERVVGGRHRGIGALLEAWAARGAIGFLGVLPEFLLAPALSGLARLARHLDRRRTQAATVFLKQALGEARDAREARARAKKKLNFEKKSKIKNSQLTLREKVGFGRFQTMGIGRVSIAAAGENVDEFEPRNAIF